MLYLRVNAKIPHYLKTFTISEVQESNLKQNVKLYLIIHILVNFIYYIVLIIHYNDNKHR